MEITIPAIINPGVSFTRNSYEIMLKISDYFSNCQQIRIPYKEFQQQYTKIDAKGDSKIRMLFPLYRKAGCIYPDDNGYVVFKNNSFFTQLGQSFFLASKIYYETLDKVKSIMLEDKSKGNIIQKKARELYFGISKELFKNLCESEDVYKNIFRCICEYKNLTKLEITILLTALEETSPKRKSVKTCSYDANRVKQLILAHRSGALHLTSEKTNNATSYFLAVLTTLLILEHNKDVYFLSQEAQNSLVTKKEMI